VNGRFLPGSGSLAHLCAIASAVHAKKPRTGDTTMFRKIRNAAFSALIGIGALAAVPAAAKADSMTFHMGGGGAGFGIWLGDSSRTHWRGPDYRYGQRYHRACTPGQALHKADRMGIRHARINRVNHRVIAVGGRARGHHVRVVFARVPGCPIIR
jgi:hypothetical protein